ncbi:hypothetical protein POTOM_007309 [Populus tomentosa]|uniref:GTP-binding protein OBGC2 n=5 Tax=Populus TaxID=3689 RepID=A0A8X8A9W1_POPTO|nr:hypothetical protein POTOM_007309 [Populus tomentosa]
MDVDPRHYEQIAIKDSDIHNIVLSYLVHNCYGETLESFVACSGMPEPADYIEDMEKRKGIVHCALEGNSLKAVELTEQVACDLLENNKDLHFDLLSLHFADLVCAKKCTEALEFAQKKLTPFGKEKKYVEKLEDFMALLAYEEPEKSPVFHLLGLEYRQHVADKLNRAILAHTNLPSYTAIERLIQQTTVVRQSLNQDHGKALRILLPPHGFGLRFVHGKITVINAFTSVKVVEKAVSCLMCLLLPAFGEYQIFAIKRLSYYNVSYHCEANSIVDWSANSASCPYLMVLRCIGSLSVKLMGRRCFARVLVDRIRSGLFTCLKFDTGIITTSPYKMTAPFQIRIMLSIPATPSSLLLSLHSGNDTLSRPGFLSNRHSFSRVSKNFEPNTPNSRFCRITCRLAKAKETISTTNPDSLIKEPHKYFDQVIVTVRSGDGGHGSILNMPNQRNNNNGSKGKQEKRSRHKSSYKRDFHGSLILPVGGHGGDVVIYADEGKDSLLELHNKSRFNAKRGGNVDAMGVLTSQLHNGLAAPTLRIPVPVGTVVKRKRGMLLADLAQPGDEILVARGGQGGISLIEAPEHRKKRLMTLTTNVMRDDSDKVLILGQSGEEVSLELILRVVADVGLVGLPNAGKSTLLAAITLAKPDIADYPFTTLMPNLGRLNGDPTLGAGMYSSEATLADLPGLIEGAHLGKGLGRNFLRHLRRTRVLVHVVDAAAEDPVNDYRTVKEELRMYNPEYLERPYVVVLNKIDLPKGRDRLLSLTEEILRIGCDEVPSEPKMTSKDAVHSFSTEDGNADKLPSQITNEDKKDKELEDYPRPLAVVGVSVLKGIRVNEMLKEIRAALRKCRDSHEALEPSTKTVRAM